ncbi:MAG: apolipoprotein N-acyltransferase [Desulfobacterales bacterium]|nr:apolipoprotein N-acyltransferase [Desulfobacterales bacterium]
MHKTGPNDVSSTPSPHGIQSSAAARRPIDRSKMFLALVAGLLLTAAFPRAGIFVLAGLGYVPLLLALRDVGPWDGLRLGLITGLAHAISLLYWIAHTITTYGHAPMITALGILLLLCTYVALYTAIFAALAVYAVRSPLVMPIALPALLTALEFLRGHLLTGFPWGFLGHSVYTFRPLIQIADVTGVHGISFVLMLVNCTIGMLILARGGKNWQGQPINRRLASRWGLATLAILTATMIYGFVRMGQVARQTQAAPKVHVAVIQGNIPQAVKWDPAFQIATTQKYIRFSQQAAAEHPDLVVWPETATPFHMHHNKVLTSMVRRGVKSAGTSFLIGSPFFIRRNDRVDYFNSAFLLHPDGDNSARYDKAHLVPFGEYVPLRRWLPFVGKLVAQVGDFVAGPPGQVLGWQKHRLAPLICYEAIFPELTRAAARNGADLLINLTNDAWYGRTSAPYQHLSLCVFRAVESRRSFIRAANTGISGFIDPSGRITSPTGLFVDAVISREVAALTTPSVYTRIGDAFAWICLLAVGLMIGAVVVMRRRPRQ